MQDHLVQPSAAITLTNTDISLFVLPVSRTTGSLFQITRATLPRKAEEGEVEMLEEEEEEGVEGEGRDGTRPTSPGRVLVRA